nr:hypothetical protein [Tanacetum cinerariifolium]
VRDVGRQQEGFEKPGDVRHVPLRGAGRLHKGYVAGVSRSWREWRVIGCSPDLAGARVAESVQPGGTAFLRSSHERAATEFVAARTSCGKNDGAMQRDFGRRGLIERRRSPCPGKTRHGLRFPSPRDMAPRKSRRHFQRLGRWLSG